MVNYMVLEEDTVKVGERGQITIPMKMREDLGIRPAQTLKVLEVGGEIVIRRRRQEQDIGNDILRILTKANLTDQDWKKIQKEREDIHRDKW